MAGDWIPIETTLPEKPEVVRVAKALGKSRDEIIGMLVRFWIWVQAHTDDGHLPGMTTEWIAEVVHVPHRLFGELEKVGWLSETEGGLCVPNFERWLSQGAKRRLRERDKKRRQRLEASAGVSRSCPDDIGTNVPKMSRCNRDKNGTRGEERREYKPPASAGGSSEPKNGSEPPPDSVLVFSCVGKQATWELTKVWLEELERLFPALDVLAECRKARAWLEASPRRRKTAGGMPRFLLNWLNRAVDGFRGAYGHAPDDPARVRSGRYQYDPNACRMVCVEADVPSATARKIPANSGGQVAGD